MDVLEQLLDHSVGVYVVVKLRALRNDYLVALDGPLDAAIARFLSCQIEEVSEVIRLLELEHSEGIFERNHRC